MKPHMTELTERMRRWSSKDQKLREAYLLERIKGHQRELAAVRRAIRLRRKEGVACGE